MVPTAPKIFANQLFMLLKTAHIHDPSNQAFRAPLENFQKVLSDLLSAEGVLRLESVEGSLYLNGEKIRTDISTFGPFRYFSEEFERKNVGGFLFSTPPETQELIDFVRVFSRPTDLSQIGAESLNGLLAARKITSIELLERVEKRSVARQAGGSAEAVTQKRTALRNYVKAVDVVKDCAGKIGSNQTFETRRAKRVVYNLVDVCLKEGFAFMGLSNIKNYDDYTFNHSVNVCIIAVQFGKNLGLTKNQLGELGVAALFHDYGKLAIPREILNKPGKFDDAEWEVMKSHPIQAVKTLLDQQKGFQEADFKKMIAAFEHHRSYDCTGYPQTGINKPMNFYSKVVAIADAYDAMTTHRVYQRAMLPTIALRTLIDNAGTKFDPLLVKAFVNTVGIYPIGTVLRMKSGEISIVMAPNTDPTRLSMPVVKIIADAAGKFFDDGPEIDLCQQTETLPRWAIQMVLRPEDYRINTVHYLFKEAGRAPTAPAPSA
ncbi:MAG: HD-GYP domain-containing protein [Pseudomonadota bacterium]